MNENLDLDVPQWYHHYRLEHHEVKGETIDGIQLVFVELKKFKPHTWPERKMAVLWLRFLTEIDGNTRKAPPELEENQDVRRALEMVEVAALTPEERAKYDGFQDWLCRETRRANAERNAAAERDAANARAEAEKERADAAIAERDAVVEKMRQDKLQTAHNLKTMNLTNEQIAATTGLAADEIKAL